MGETSGNERSLTSTAGILSALVLGVVCLLTTMSAFAACLTSPDPEVRRLQSLVSQDAAKAVTAAQARIDALKNSSPERTAAFYSVLAQAFQTLELDRDARKAASTGLALVPRPDDPVHLDLLMSLSENIYDSAGLSGAMADIEAAQRVVERGSMADTCLAITAGRLQHRQDRDDLAVLTLTRAYRSSMSPGMSSPRDTPSQVAWARVSGRSTSFTAMTERAETMMGRSDNVCGQIGATTNTSRWGETMGPPQESAEAVEPVALAMTRPSPPWLFT